MRWKRAGMPRGGSGGTTIAARHNYCHHSAAAAAAAAENILSLSQELSKLNTVPNSRWGAVAGCRGSQGRAGQNRAAMAPPALRVLWLPHT